MKILVAEDDRDTRVTFSRLLQMIGHDVHSAADGQEAVDLAAAFRPDAVLLDLWMPKLTGYQAATRIRALLPNALLIAITGVQDRGGVEAYKAAGFDYYFLKPVGLIQIRDLLEKHRP